MEYTFPEFPISVNVRFPKLPRKFYIFWGHERTKVLGKFIDKRASEISEALNVTAHRQFADYTCLIKSLNCLSNLMGMGHIHTLACK